MRFHNPLMLSAMFTATVLAAGLAPSVLVAEEANRPARLEKVEGSEIPNVILLEQAVKRLGIQTTEVREETAKRWLVRVGEVEPAARDVQGLAVADAGLGAAVAAVKADDAGGSRLWIRIPADGEGAMNSQQILLAFPDASAEDAEDYADAADPFGEIDDSDVGDIEEDDGNRMLVVVVPIGADSAVKRYKARPVDVTAGMAAPGQYFEPVNSTQALKQGQQVFIRAAQPDSGDKARIVPYSAVIYDVKGGSWLYANPEPLKYVRHKIAIERILGNVAVLSDGPAAGTRIVSVGAAELMGIEQKIGH